MRSKTQHFGSRLAFSLLVSAALMTAVPPASAEVRREGAWPTAPEPVSLSLNGVSRSEAIQKLAETVGWSVVVQLPAGGAVDLHVKNEDASKVLALLLGDGRYVANRDGALVDIRLDSLPAASSAEGGVPGADAPASGAAGVDPPAASGAPAGATPVGPAPASAAPPSSPEPPAAAAPAPAEQGDAATRGEDRTITGGNGRVERDETVHDLVVMGGEAEVLGRVTGDLAVVGGEAVIRNGARVDGDVSVVGGQLVIEDGARVDGDVGVVGGEVVRGPDAGIGGKVSAAGGDVRVGVVRSGDDSDDATDSPGLLSRIGSALSHMALLFAFGAVMFGLAPRRMERLQTEVAARPGRVFAYGVLGMVVGAITLGALCITIVGIPWAILAALLSVVAAYAGVCGVLAAAGAALVRHRSASPYVHLAVGCLLLLVVGALPWVGSAVTALLAVLGVGAFVVTRAAGLVPDRRERNAEAGPYRTAADV